MTVPAAGIRGGVDGAVDDDVATALALAPLASDFSCCGVTRSVGRGGAAFAFDGGLDGLAGRVATTFVYVFETGAVKNATLA